MGKIPRNLVLVSQSARRSRRRQSPRRPSVRSIIMTCHWKTPIRAAGLGADVKDFLAPRRPKPTLSCNSYYVNLSQLAIELRKGCWDRWLLTAARLVAGPRSCPLYYSLAD